MTSRRTNDIQKVKDAVKGNVLRPRTPAMTKLAKYGTE
jgi:hypothetical protein